MQSSEKQILVFIKTTQRDAPRSRLFFDRTYVVRVRRGLMKTNEHCSIGQWSYRARSSVAATQFLISAAIARRRHSARKVEDTRDHSTPRDEHCCTSESSTRNFCLRLAIYTTQTYFRGFETVRVSHTHDHDQCPIEPTVVTA